MESRFYIADDIQVLQGGKLAMIGVSADAVLVVQQKGLLSKKRSAPRRLRCPGSACL